MNKKQRGLFIYCILAQITLANIGNVLFGEGASAGTISITTKEKNNEKILWVFRI